MPCCFSCEAELRARGHAVQPFNVSYSGIGTAQELILFRQNVARIRPSVVVLVVYPCNDVIDNTPELVGHTTKAAFRSTSSLPAKNWLRFTASS